MIYSVKVYEAIIFLIIAFRACNSVQKCPDRKNTEGCSCKYFEEWDEINVWCKYLTQRDLMNKIKYFRGYNIGLFKLYESDLDTIESYTFRNMSIKILIFLNIKITTIDLFHSLRGIRNLRSLVLQHFDVTNWRHSKGDFLQQLVLFNLDNCIYKQNFYPYDTIIHSLPNTVSLIDLRNCTSLSEPEKTDSLFTTFQRLQYLDLSNNALKTIKRNYVARPAEHLMYYILRQNEINHLPEDAFVDMPALYELDLSENKITILPYEIFKSMLYYLQNFIIYDNPLTCSYNNCWLLIEFPMFRDNNTNIPCYLQPSLRENKLSSPSPMEMRYALDLKDVCKSHYKTQDKVLPVVLSLFVLLAKSLEWHHKCPSPEEMYPCRCAHNEGWNTVEVECADVNQDQLKKVNKNLYKHFIDTYYIHDSKLEEIEKSIFRDVTVSKFRIFNSEVESFSLFNVVEGMQQTLQEITISNVSVEYWITSPGDTFVNLKVFKFNECPVNPRNESRIVPYLPKNLIEVNFHRCRITSKEEFTFKEFTRLEHVVLSGNRLTSVKRSYLSQPALHVSFYSLSNNPITALPDDMFIDMPALRTVWLQGTQLNILPYHIFKPILKHLLAIQIWDIPLNCNCDNAWLLTERNIWEISGATCDNPSRLKNRELDSLTKEDMCTTQRITSIQTTLTNVTKN